MNVMDKVNSSILKRDAKSVKVRKSLETERSLPKTLTRVLHMESNTLSTVKVIAFQMLSLEMLLSL